MVTPGFQNGKLALIPAAQAELAPEWRVTEWFNAVEPISLASLRGRVVVLHAFQMLCPGCVSHGVPQAQRVNAQFSPDDVAVIGLHTVFEHHDAMGPVSLAAFLHEYRVAFPVGIDEASADSPIPQTMTAYGMRGTPSLVLIDRHGRVRLHTFGRPDDMAVGAAVASLVAEPLAASKSAGIQMIGLPDAPGCSDDGCEI